MSDNEESPLVQRPNARCRVRGRRSEASPNSQLEYAAVEPDQETGSTGAASKEPGAVDVGGTTAQEYALRQYSASDLLEVPGSRRSDEGGETLPEYRSAAVGNFKFEYLNHTADVQLHAWGQNLTEAFENCALAMFNYMSPLEHVRQRESRKYRAEGHDLPSLLYAFLDEMLFIFATELFIAKSVKIAVFDRDSFVIEAEGFGETLDRAIHEIGTEIKAITYSAMSIQEHIEDAEVFVIVDI